MQRLTQLVQSAIGFDQSRGDIVSVDSLRFMDYSMDVGDPVGTTFGEQIKANLPVILRSLFALALVAAVLILGVRPLTRVLGAAQNGGDELALAGGMPAGALMADGVTPRNLPIGPIGATGSGGVPGAGQQQEDMQDDSTPRSGTILGPYDPAQPELVAIAAVEGGVLRQRVNKIGEMVDDAPEEAMKVLQAWLAEEV